MFEIGQSVGDYEVLGMLASGGMGQVYRVRNVISNRVEAMKVVLANLVAESDIAERFMGEIRISRAARSSEYRQAPHCIQVR